MVVTETKTQVTRQNRLMVTIVNWGRGLAEFRSKENICGWDKKRIGCVLLYCWYGQTSSKNDIRDRGRESSD